MMIRRRRRSSSSSSSSTTPLPEHISNRQHEAVLPSCLFQSIHIRSKLFRWHHGKRLLYEHIDTCSYTLQLNVPPALKRAPVRRRNPYEHCVGFDSQKFCKFCHQLAIFVKFSTRRGQPRFQDFLGLLNIRVYNTDDVNPANFLEPGGVIPW